MISLVSLAFGAVLSTVAATQPLPSTQQGYYDLGQEFANCSAHQALAAFVADRSGLDETTTMAKDRARGWKFAGMVFLAEGLDAADRPQTERTFDGMVRLKLEELKARYDGGGDAPKAAIPQEYAKACSPLLPLQEMVIAMIGRTG
jgi:hypothetical protein